MNSKKVSFERSVGLFALTMTGVGSMIGSGWLFSVYLAAQLAGPAAIFCWIIAGSIITLIALTVAELGSAFPQGGGVVRYLEFSHGPLTGFTLAFANWIGTVASITLVAEGSVQYASSWDVSWARNLYELNTHSLTTSGLIATSALLLFYFFINYWSMKLFVRFNSAITVFKIVVPIITIIMFLYAGFHPGNFTQVGNVVAPYGWPSILTAMITCGIVLSFYGFQSPANLGGEAKRPQLNLPLAIIIGVLIALVIYLGLQIAYIGAVPPELLTQFGWRGINFKSPLVQLALALQLNFIALLLYADSFISPSGTGMVYTATTARMLYGMQRNGYMPKFMGWLNPQYHVPRNAMWVNLLISFIFMLCFRSWQNIVALIAVINIISLIPGPIAMAGLRRVAPDLSRVFKLPFGNFIAMMAFILLSFLLYWARWPLTGQVDLLLGLSLVVYFYYQHQQGWPNFIQQLTAAAWLIVYFIGMVLISYGGGKEFGGKGYLSNEVSQSLLLVFTLGIYIWAIRSAWRTPLLVAWIKKEEPNH